MDRRTEGGRTDPSYNFDLALNSQPFSVVPVISKKKSFKVIVMNKTEMKLLFFCRYEQKTIEMKF